MKQPRIYVSLGDPAGIGLFWLSQLKKSQSVLKNKKWPNSVFFGDLYPQLADKIKSLFEIISLEKFHQFGGDIPLHKKPLFVYEKDDLDFNFGEASLLSGARSFRYFELATQAALNDPDGAIITLPVSKEWILKNGITFHGHTEQLATVFNAEVFMLMYHQKLSVLPLTNHIPLNQVSSAITKINIEALAKSVKFFQALFTPQKPIAFCGLNPHAGEDGKIGSEESILKKYILQLQQEGLDMEGPLSADSVFTQNQRRKYSIVIANYHDQGLIPFKALFGEQGLNITLNLPMLRVSPDHGPAYAAVAEQQADFTSIEEAFLFCFKYNQIWKQVYSSL